MMNDNCKNILIICPVFHGYEERIISCIRQSKKYNNIYYIKDTPLNSEKIYLYLKNLIPRLSAVLLKLFNKRILKFVRKNKINTLFIVKGTYVYSDTMSIIQKEFPEIKVVLYEWDSIFSNPNALNLLNVIKNSYTFDFDDAHSYDRYKYLPLFYSFDQLPEQTHKNKDIDFLLVCAFSVERMPIFLKIKDLCERNGWIFAFHFYVQHGVYLKYKSTMRPYKSFISFESLDYEKYYSLVCRAKAVVDIVGSGQTGLTIRTIEALSQNCHLLTTNKRIAEMEFYTDNNITIVDYNKISKEVLEMTLKKEFDKSYNNEIYSTKEWLKKMDIV